MALSENIRDRRMRLKLSQEYVADQLGISRQAVAKWEAGKSEPTAANLAQLAALFETQVSELVEPQGDTEARQERKKPLRERMGAAMPVLRTGGFILLNTGWDEYAEDPHGPLSRYWLAVLGAGLLLILLTSLDLYQRRRLKKPQAAAGAAVLFSIFLLPGLLPLEEAGLRRLLGDLAAAVCLSLLYLRYWRPIWSGSSEEHAGAPAEGRPRRER